MNPSKLFPLFVAALCITGIGVSATSMESSVSTDPDEVIDTYELLPIGQGDAHALQKQMEGDDSGDQGGQDESESEAASESQSSSSESENTGMGATPPSLLDRLLDLLLSVLRFLLAVAVIVALGAVGYRYRDRIVDAFWDLLQPNDDAAAIEYEERSWPADEPSNAVERAWLELVRRVDPERPAIMTPAECAAAAKQAGLESSAVETITSAFERVEYGGVPPDEEARRVEDALDEIQGRRGGIGSRFRRGRGAGGGDD
jgi:hypothetical protein